MHVFLTLTISEADFRDMWAACGHSGDRPPPAGYQNADPIGATHAYDCRVREFFKRFITGGLEIFGKVKHMWARHEAQYRGALHLHCALWLEGGHDACKVRATVPRADSTTRRGQELRKMVLRLQKHSCSGRKCKSGCWAQKPQCQYGFPGALRGKDGIEQDRWQYRRVELEDQSISPYHALALYLWGGHLNVQLVNMNDLVSYICKYAAKACPVKRLDLSDELRVEICMSILQGKDLSLSSPHNTSYTHTTHTYTHTHTHTRPAAPSLRMATART